MVRLKESLRPRGGIGCALRLLLSALRKFLREDVMISIMDVRVVESRPLKTILVTLQVSEGGKRYSSEWFLPYFLR